MIKQTLTKVTVFLGKNKKGTASREGYRNQDNLVFIPPKSVKRVTAWQKSMKDRGFSFE
jgi:hypothetical protein